MTLPYTIVDGFPAPTGGIMGNYTELDNRDVPIGAIIPWAKTLGQKATGTNTTSTANKLIASGASFLSNSISAGMIVENNTDGTFANVVSVDSNTQLTLDANIFTATGKTYYVWSTSKLAANWKECDGSTISDAGSPINGIALPNLNGTTEATKIFLRGAKRSGATGGSNVTSGWSTGSGSFFQTGTSVNQYFNNTQTCIPPYYEIVQIMRIK